MFQFRDQLYGSSLTPDFRGEKEVPDEGSKGSTNTHEHLSISTWSLHQASVPFHLWKQIPRREVQDAWVEFLGGAEGKGAKHKHLSDIQQISIFKIPNSAVKFQGKWRAWGKRGFVLIWNVALCAYFVQDFLSGGQIILHPKQTLLFLLVTALQLIITSHTTITNECEPHHYPQSLTGFRKKA